MRNDPQYRKNILQQQEQVKQYIQKNKSWLTTRSNAPQAPLYTIPVVVHVIHTGGAVGSIYNPTDAQIQNTIAYLNAVYNGSYPGTEGIGDLQLQFVLAQRDPNCNPTNGINRIDGSSVAEYATLLERQGFTVTSALYFNRETALTSEEGMKDWINMFASFFFRKISKEQSEKVIAEAIEYLRTTNYRDGVWYADYVRLRMKAIKN